MIAKSQSAYERIKEMILCGDLPPKADVSEKQLQDMLGLGRTPVHEALIKLQEGNFIETYPRKGSFVTDVTIEQVRDLYETRLMIEPYITVTAIGCVSEDWLNDLKQRLLVEKPLESKDEIHCVMALDTELHTVIASCCENSFLRDVLCLVYDHDRRIRLKTDRNPNQVRFSQREHVKIIDAMLAKDGPLAETLAREHVIHSRDMTFESLGF